MTEITELPWCKHGINKSGYCADCKVESLITTIESQKETIDEQYMTISTANIWNSKLKDQLDSQKEETADLKTQSESHYNHFLGANDEADVLFKQVESLKAITELAVKGLTEISKARGTSDHYWINETLIAKKSLSEIERLSHETNLP